jgi:phosphate starvation-inducible PhoH-like protein
MSKRKITKKTRPQRDEIIEKPVKRSAGNFHIEFKNEQQRKAWQTIEQNEITFLIGPAGSAKSFISSAYSCSSILTKRQQKILLTRPIVEATASIGYLPGTFEEKVNPYITPIYDALDELVGPVGFQREIVNKSIQIRPLNYMRGCNFNDAICLHDEAQNNDFKSLLLYITRLGRNSKMIINGDPNQVDIKNSALMEVINKLEGLPGIGVVRFDKSAIVRNPLISQILDRLAPDQSI